MDRYFVPQIEDIRVGYELETDYPISDSRFAKQTITKEDLGFHITMLEGASYRYRVPYLTKEQIEVEGWAEDTNPNDFLVWGAYDFTIENFRLQWFYLNHLICIVNTSGISNMIWYYGECKDINTFRYICKLLNIN